MIKTVINVTAPRQQVFSILSDYPNYKAWVPGCEKCSVLSSSGNSSDTEIIISSMKRIELGVRFEAQPDQALNFRMTKGKDLVLRTSINSTNNKHSTKAMVSSRWATDSHSKVLYNLVGLSMWASSRCPGRPPVPP